jgi:glycine dehydrogenase subunit 1
MGVDVICGEAQSFGNSPGFGGPLLGYISANKSFLRNMPGRLVGLSKDEDGNNAYVLTLQTREQHIRREKATSNICSNQGLCLLRAVIYLSYYGNKLRDLALYNHKIASYLHQNLISKGFEVLYDQPFFNEFIIKFKDAEKLLSRLKDNGINAGVYLGEHFEDCPHCILICATEMNSKDDVDKLVETIESLA